jgi:hypothetical protein
VTEAGIIQAKYKYVAYISKDLSDTEGLNFKWYRQTRYEEIRNKTMQVRVAAEESRDVADRIIKLSENGRMHTKTHRYHVASDTSVSTCVEYRNSAVYIKYKNT